MFKLVLAALVGAGVFWYVTDNSNAMQKCQQKYSYGTCVSLLR